MTIKCVTAGKFGLLLLPMVASAGDFDDIVRPFLARNCEICHNQKLQTGNLNLSAFTADSVERNRGALELIVKKLRSGEMPPKGLPPAESAHAQAVTSWIQGELDRQGSLAKPSAGHVTARRLNRAEYNNTIHDLLGLDLRPADDFPQDDAGYGFDNIGDVLSLSPVLMEKYLTAAESVARTALFGPGSRKPSMVRFQPFSRRGPTHTQIPPDYDLTGLTLPSALHTAYRVPVEGDYVLKAGMVGLRAAGSSPIQLAFWIDGKQLQLLPIDPDVNGPSSAGIAVQDFFGQEREFRTHIAAGEHWLSVSIPRLYEGLPESFHGPNPSHRPLPPPMEFPEYVRRTQSDATPEKLDGLRKTFKMVLNMSATLDGFRVDFLDLAGPFDVTTKPSSLALRKIYVCGHLDGHHQPSCGRVIVSNLLRRAFRRPVTAGEIEQYTKLVRMAGQQGDSFADGIEVALEAILVSPDFLFRIESGRDLAAAHPISQHELASRLSYFLWSSMPDESLLGLADRGALRQPGVLAAQVRRMLRDPKSSRLVENFGGQWLGFRALESIERDRQLFPGFDDYLRLSMKQETTMFMESIVRDNRSILDFIDGKFTFVNERLAELYGLPGVKGPEFRRVELTGNPQRGGVLTQASVLAVSSYATRASPVLRGKWILENLLNDAPPPPPPDVPNLDVANVGTSVSLRRQLEAHRANAVCASCHQKMDPLGFSLSNYDAIGAWQTKEGKFEIDASGALPDGRTFNGPEGLRGILDGDREAFVRCVAEKLLTYALGRGLESFDRPAVKNIVAQAAGGGYRFDSLILGIVNSVPFQMQAGQRRPAPQREQVRASNDHHQ